MEEWAEPAEEWAEPAEEWAEPAEEWAEPTEEWPDLQKEESATQGSSFAYRVIGVISDYPFVCIVYR